MNTDTNVHATPELRKALRQQADIVGRGDLKEAVAAAQILTSLGAVKGCNLDSKTMKDGDDACVAWFAGQFLDIVESEAWFAVNSWLNCVDRFCPERAPS